VDAILRRRAAAVLKRNEAQFLADVDPRNKKLLAAQKVLFGNLVQFGFAKLSYVPGRPQVKQPLIDQYGPSTYLVSVAMRYQISGIDEQPVETALGYLFVQRGGRYVLIDDTQLDVSLPRGSHREAWDFGPVLVRRGTRALAVVEPGNAKLAAAILADAETAVRTVNKRWSASWRGGGLVIALTLKEEHVRGIDFANPQGEFLATTTRVYRTLPSETQKYGTYGGGYVVVNPSDRYELDAPSLAHEFTHVAVMAYGPSAPRWLAEGAARYVENQPVAGEPEADLDRDRKLYRANYLSKANTLPSDELFYKTPDSSYAIGWLAVDHLVRKYGQAKVLRLYRELASRGTDQNQRDLIMTAQLGRTEQQLFADLKRG
jgi:hypothetical protein